MYKYWGFGLHIISEIEFPELLPTDFDHAQLTISIGKVPQDLEGEKVIRRPFSIIGHQEYVLNLNSVAKYYAGHGHTIIVEPVVDENLDSIRLFLLGTVMAAILYQRKSIPLHASAIEKDGKLILFTGNSGVGKSTLLANLATRGFQVFTDDICVLNHDKDQKIVFGIASYPMLKLWEDALTKINSDSYTTENKIRPHLPKYAQFFHKTFNTKMLPVEKVFILQISNNENITHQTLSNVAAFKNVERQAYKYRLTSGDILRPEHFSVMSALVNQTQVITIKRPHYGTTINEFCDIIEKLF